MHDKFYRKSCIPYCDFARAKLDDAQEIRSSKIEHSQIVSNQK